MAKIKNLIFDIDGTLINTYAMYMPALFAVLAKHGYKFKNSEELAKQFYGIAAVDTLLKLGIPKQKIPVINREWLQCAYQHFDQVTVFPGVAKTIERLAAVPTNHLAIVTSKTRAEYQKYFQNQYDFAAAFSIVITADDTDQHKPDPAPLKLAIAKMGVNPAETVYVGDMPTDCQAAHAAGIGFVAADYGSRYPEQLAAADYHLQQPATLLELG